MERIFFFIGLSPLLLSNIITILSHVGEIKNSPEQISWGAINNVNRSSGNTDKCLLPILSLSKKAKYNTDNLSEAIRLAISECLLNEDKGKIKTLFDKC